MMKPTPPRCRTAGVPSHANIARLLSSCRRCVWKKPAASKDHGRTALSSDTSQCLTRNDPGSSCQRRYPTISRTASAAIGGAESWEALCTHQELVGFEVLYSLTYTHSPSCEYCMWVHQHRHGSVHVLYTNLCIVLPRTGWESHYMYH